MYDARALNKLIGARTLFELAKGDAKNITVFYALVSNNVTIYNRSTGGDWSGFVHSPSAAYDGAMADKLKSYLRSLNASDGDSRLRRSAG